MSPDKKHIQIRKLKFRTKQNNVIIYLICNIGRYQLLYLYLKLFLKYNRQRRNLV